MTKDELELEKLRLEIEQEKLEVELKRIEVKGAERPFLKQLTTWISVISMLIGVVSSSQWYGTAKEKTKVAEAASKTSNELEAANRTIEAARFETVRNAERFAKVEAKIAEAQGILDQSERTPAPEAARVKASLTEARAASVELRAGFADRLTTLQPVRIDPEAQRVIRRAAPRK